MKTIAKIALALCLVLPTYSYCNNDYNSEIKKTSFYLDSLATHPGIAVYGELVGKGFYSLNVDFPIDKFQRFSFGLTALDYSFAEHEDFSVGGVGALTPGLMYYILQGRNNSYFELGVGFSLFYRLDLDYPEEDSPLSFHGVIGYRYQKPDGILFRVGFTPFKRVNNWFLPLVGISLGYSW